MSDQFGRIDSGKTAPNPVGNGQECGLSWIDGLRRIYGWPGADVSGSGSVGCERLDEEQSLGEYPEQVFEGIGAGQVQDDMILVLSCFP